MTSIDRLTMSKTPRSMNHLWPMSKDGAQGLLSEVPLQPVSTSTRCCRLQVNVHDPVAKMAATEEEVRTMPS